MSERTAKELADDMHEMLVARLLGDLIDFGKPHVVLALTDAMKQFNAWREEHDPEHVPRYIKLRALPAARPSSGDT